MRDTCMLEFFQLCVQQISKLGRNMDEFTHMLLYHLMVEHLMGWMNYCKSKPQETWAQCHSPASIYTFICEQ